MNMRITACTVGGLMLSAGAANAAFLQMDHPITLSERSAVSVEVFGANGGAAGDLYFVGTTSGDTWTPAPDPTGGGIGTRLFNSKDTPGTRVELGTFDAGTEFTFAYKVTKGWSKWVIVDDVMMSGREGDAQQFGVDDMLADSGRVRLGIEDIRDPKKSDWDYDDSMFDVVITPTGDRGAVPTPGSTALIGLASFAALGRRRR